MSCHRQARCREKRDLNNLVSKRTKNAVKPSRRASRTIERFLLPGGHGAFFDDVTVLVKANHVHRVLEALVLASLVVMNDGLLHVGQDLLDARNMLDEDALDAFGKREGGKRTIHAGAPQGDVDDALLVIDFRDVKIAAVRLYLGPYAAYDVIEHTSIDHESDLSHTTNHPHCRLPLEGMDGNNSKFTIEEHSMREINVKRNT